MSSFMNRLCLFDGDRIQYYVFVRFVLPIAWYVDDLLDDVLAFYHFAEDCVIAG